MSGHHFSFLTDNHQVPYFEHHGLVTSLIYHLGGHALIMACAAKMAYNKSVNIYNLFDELWIAEDYHEHS